MKKILCFLIPALFSGVTFAAGTTPAPDAKSPQPTAQQMKMMNCGKLAKGKKGDEHKAFMKDCLAKQDGDRAASGDDQAAQRDKIRACNKEAMWKKGDEHEAFMKDCMSKK